MNENMRYIAAYIVRDRETGLYVGTIPGIPGGQTQGDTLDELHKNLKDVVKLCWDEMTPEEKKGVPEFMGIQKVEVMM